MVDAIPSTRILLAEDDLAVALVLEGMLNHNYTDSLENIFINAQTQMLLLYSLECMLGEKEVESFQCKFLANGADREKINNPTLAAVLKHQNKIEKTYIINAGLDVVYMGAGLLMNKTSDNQKNPDKFEGYGNSILLQGGFLLVYDAINYAIHKKHGKQLKGMVDKVSLSGGPASVSLVYNF